MRIGVVTTYPDGTSQKSGIAYYAQTLITPLADGPDSITIFADKSAEGKKKADRAGERLGKSVRILRCWRFGFMSPFSLARAIRKQPPDVLHVEYDVYQFGGVVVAILLPLMLGLFRAVYNMQVVTTIHGVVPQHAVTREMLHENGFVLPFSRIGKLGFRVVYGLFNKASDRIIVLEHALAEILHTDYGVAREKIFVIPIPLMHEAPRPSAAEARLRSGIVNDRCLTFVGYASYYKGLALLLDAFELARRHDSLVELHIVSGRHPRLAGDRRYESFYTGLVARANEVGARWHGFLPDDQVADMLAASAAVIFPYTAAYGGSAALNMALAARRPVLVSSVMYFEGALPGQVFEPNARSCARAMLRFFQQLRHVLEEQVEEFASQRDVGRIALHVHHVRCNADINKFHSTRVTAPAPEPVVSAKA